MYTFVTHLKGYFKTMRNHDGVNELTALRLNIYITFYSSSYSCQFLCISRRDSHEIVMYVLF